MTDNLWLVDDTADDLPAAEARLGQTYGINPEQAAKLDALARRAKIPYAAAETQPDLLGQQRAAEINKQALTTSAATRAFVAADKANADMIADHVPQASALEKSWGVLKDVARGGAGIAGSAVFRMTSGLWGAIEASAEAPRLLPESDQSRELRAQAAQYARQRRLYGQQMADQMRPETGSWWGDALVSGVESTVQSAGLVAASVAMRSPAPLLVGVGAITGGEEYGKARDEGQTPLRSLAYGGGQAGFEVLTEMIPAGILLKGLREGAGPLKSFARSLAAELPGEQIATLTQDLNEWVTLNPEKPVSQFLAERPQAAAETALATLTSTGGNVAAGQAAQSVLNRLAARDEMAEEAPQAAAAFDKLVKDTTSMPLRERSPERFQALMDAQTDGIQVHVNAKALGTYLQSLDPEEQAIIVEATGIGAQLGAATADTDIVIPAGAYLTYVAPEGHSFLQKDIRLGPSAMSVNEAEAHKEDRERLLAETAAKALDTGSAIAQIEDPVERVRQHFYESAVAVGVPEDQARANATLQASYYAQRAARNTTFKDAWAAYEDANISMRGAGVTTEGPRGLATGGPAFDLQQNDLPAFRDIRPPVENIGTVISSNFESGRAVGNDMVPLAELNGAMVEAKDDNSRADELARVFKNDDSYFARIIVDQDNNVVEGQHRLEALRRLGVENVPVFRIRDTLAGFPTKEVKTAIEASKPTHSDHVNQIAAQLADIYTEEKGNMREVRKWDAPRGYAVQWEAAVAALAKAVKGKKFQQDKPTGKGPRGQVSFAPQGTLIELFKSRNASTLIHEGAGHIWLENLARDAQDANATDEVRADFQAIKDWWLANIDQAVKESGLPEKRLRAAVENFGGDTQVTLQQAAPTLIPAIKTKAGKVYKGEAGREHTTVVEKLDPADREAFNNDLDAVTIGFMNHKGQFLTRERALEYAIENDLIVPAWREYAKQGLSNTGGLATHFLPKARGKYEQDGKRKSANADVEAIRPFHEMFARAAEQYVMEGKAPSESLRAVFAKFRQWLVAIYKDFTRLRVPMTDEIRQVFDRLAAGPEAIAETQEEQGLTPFFADPATAGMSDAEYAAYLDTIRRADEAAEDRLLAKLLSDIRRKYTESWKAERAGLVEDFQAEVNDTPIMRAVSMLETGEVRLAREAVQAYLGDRDEAALYRRSRQYVFGEGVHPDVVAEMAGLSSGQELIDQLLALKEEHDVLRAVGDKRTVRVARAEALADAEMLARHGDILNDGTIGDEAMAALHDVRRSEVLMAEVRALVRKAGASTVLWTEAEMQAWAGRQIGALQVDAVRPHVYRAAGAKAGRDALKALVTDDFQAALDAKFRQLLNAHLYRAARDARERIDKGKALFERIVAARDGSIAKSRNMDMVGAARQILRAYGYASSLHDADYMTKVALYDPELWSDLRDPITQALAFGDPAKGVDVLSLDQFESLRGIVDQLWRMSRTSRQMQIDFETLELEDIASDLANTLGNVVSRPNTHAPTNTEHALRILSGFRAALRRVESWVSGVDGGNKGHWRTYVWQPVSDAAVRFRTAKAQYLDRFVQLLAPIQKDLKRGKIEAPELAYTFGFANNGVGKSELLHALLHTGNDSNKRKLLLGRGWATERTDGSLDTQAWDAFLARMHAEGVITEADWQFAQAVWDLLEEMKPDAQRAHRQVFGRYFEEVTANPVVTPFGTFRGGYVPAITDTFLVQEQALNAQADAITDANDASMFPSPNRGFTKSRVDYNKPLLLDLGLLPAHIDKVLKFTHMTAPVRDVLRLLKEKGLSSKLEAFDAAVVPDLLLPWLNRSAKQIVEVPSKGNAGKGADAFFRALRHRTGMGIMIANVSNTLQQLTGLAPAALKVRKRSLSRALWQMTRDPAGMVDAIQAMSPYMATRTSAIVQETNAQLEQLLIDPTKYQKVSEFAQRHAYIMQSHTQNFVDGVVWSAAFEEGLERGEELTEAVRSADAVIRETQGTLAPEDVSRFEVNSPFVRMFTQFYSYFNVQSNLWVTEFKNSKTLTRAAYVYIMGIAVPAIISEAIRVSFGGGWDDDDDDGYLDQFLDVFFGSQFRYAVAAIPVAGQVIANAANQFNDRPYDDQLVPAPAFSTVQQIAKLPEDIWLTSTEGKRQKATVRETATLLTLLTGIPWFNVAARPLGYAADVNEGKVQPTSGVDLARGLVTGSASEASRVQ